MASSIFNNTKNVEKIAFHSPSFFRIGDEFKIENGDIIYYRTISRGSNVLVIRPTENTVIIKAKVSRTRKY